MKAASGATGSLPLKATAPPLAADARGPGVALTAGCPAQSAAHAEGPPEIGALSRHDIATKPFHADLAIVRRQAAARELDTVLRFMQGVVDRHTETEERENGCEIRMKSFAQDEKVSYLQCQHHFHIGCSDDWCATRLRQDGRNEHSGCPLCRTEVNVLNVLDVHDIPQAGYRVHDSRENESSLSNSDASRQSAFPIFPAQLGSTNPKDGANNPSRITTKSMNERVALILNT